MVAQPPAVVIVARHGMRLDAADQSWHLSTPTPYDPPLTYGGWNQCRALGVRIASLLHTREQNMNNMPTEIGEHGINGTSMLHRRRRRRHKVVIHTSPFLRCLQTSVAISAGMAQFEAPKDRRPSTPRSPGMLHSASPRLRAKEGGLSPVLAPIAEPRHHFARDIARRTLGGPMRHRKAKIRVDAFLGEWLNPSYFDQITPPPPSPMMVAGAKAELMQSENVDIFTPTLSHKSSGGSLWSAARSSTGSREGPLEDWSHVTEALNARPKLRRERSNSASSIGSNDSTGGYSSSGRRSPFRPGGQLQPLTSTIPKPEHAVYRPPTPSYAISNSDTIPRGYITHARNATVNVDYPWDSSRAPLNWGSGGEHGEEWSSMHKRFRRGFNSLIEWYSQHNADDRGEDALGLDQADHQHDEDDEQEELVVILVTHGAGSNALIGALTNQPVLLDVGMASLTMAVRKDNAPPLLSPEPSNPTSPLNEDILGQSHDPMAQNNYYTRRSSMDIGLSAIYDMKLVASTEHLRPGADPSRIPGPSTPAALKANQEALARYKQFGAAAHGEAGAGIESNWDLGEPHTRRSNQSTAVGSIRRPHNSIAVPARPTMGKSYSLPADERPFVPPVFSTGLWTPPSARGTPPLNGQNRSDEKDTLYSRLDEKVARPDTDRDMMLDFANSPPDSRPASSTGDRCEQQPLAENSRQPEHEGSAIVDSDDADNLPSVSERLPKALSRGLSQRGLWGNQPSGAKVTRRFENSPKRRWTVTQKD